MAQEIYHRSEWGNPTETWGNTYLNADLTNELYKRASEYENSWVTDQLLNGVGIKPSIILTPTAYEDGKLNSVKPAKTFGSELVTNGGFDTDSDWTLGTGATIENGLLNFNNVNNDETRQLNLFPTPSLGTYVVSFDISNYVSGHIDLYLGGFQRFNFNADSNGTWTRTCVITNPSSNNIFYFIGDNFTGSIDNVSVKEVIEADFDFTRGSSATRVNEQGLVEDVQILSGELVQNGNFEQIGSEQIVNGGFDTDSDWTKGTGWSISGGKAISDGTIGSYNLTQGGAVTVGKIYKITITVSDYVSGNVEVSAGASPRGTMNANGTYTFYQKATPANSFYIIANSFLGSVDNVSVKEVGQNWTFEGGAYFTANGVNIQHTPSAGILTSDGYTALVVGRKYRMTYEIVENNAGAIKLASAIDEPMVSTVGTHTKEFIADQSNVRIIRDGATVDVTIDNISVVEVTDDTDLPRINYTDGEGSLLLEPQSTNLVTYSENLTTDWTRSGISTPTDADIDAPDGSETVKRLQTNNADGSIAFTYNTTFNQVSGTTYTVSVYAKSYNGTNQLFGIFGNGSGSSNTHSGNLTATNKWQRFTYTFTASNTSTAGLCKGNDRLAFDILFWGFQLEELSYATSYIPTNGSTVTRLADVCNNSGNSDLINSTEGVLYAEISALNNGGTNRILSLSDETDNNLMFIRFDATADRILCAGRGSGGTYNILTTNGVDQTNNNKIALVWDNTNVRVWINGSQTITQTINNSPIGMSTLSFTNQTNLDNLYGNVKCVAVFKEALSDTELQKLTTI